MLVTFFFYSYTIICRHNSHNSIAIWSITSDHNKRQITLTVITLSSFHCTLSQSEFLFPDIQRLATLLGTWWRSKLSIWLFRRSSVWRPDSPENRWTRKNESTFKSVFRTTSEQHPPVYNDHHDTMLFNNDYNF